ncbi:MAG: response regulator transcription factor [Bryobacteraceae bacterium]
MMNEITVLLVDDHQLVRKGFRRILEDDPDLRVVGEAGSGVEAIQMAERFTPRVIVMDMAMPGLDGVQATKEVLRRLPATAILILSMYAEESYIRNAFEAGAKGYLLKNAIEVDLTEAVKTVAGGKQYKSPGLPSGNVTQTDGFELLTQREKQVLQLIAQGNSNKEIAALLSLSVNTVSVHRANLMEALNIHRTAELVVYAIKKGLVTL